MILDYFKKTSFFIVLSVIVWYFCSIIESNYLMEFLDKNLISLLIALFAINTTTSSFVLTKLKDINQKYGGNFEGTLGQFRISVIEQLVFIVFALLILVLLNSQSVVGLHSLVLPILEVLLIVVFIASLDNLYDTANSIFVILSWESGEGR
ncbi:hypothetical protein [Pseudoalteromonas sp. SWN166]|uniref:hypothetical protein n=1 Tax=Pseudoalteromonas sp. SWN166 TaxID=2792061 RepID=UPI0018CE2BEE|nr:hypothetical protein [Pseudoalteromonas sp. SWN166]MBH0040435.1 hypothetical protein [Pseudoalteromonas sp. SWN166]